MNSNDLCNEETLGFGRFLKLRVAESLPSQLESRRSSGGDRGTIYLW